MDSSTQSLRVAVGLALICAAGLYVSYWPLHFGLSISLDSVYYLDTAVRLSRLHDASQLSAQWPPVYPFLLSLLLGALPWPGTAAGLFNAFCLTATLLVTWYTCFKITAQPLLASALAALCLASPVTYWVMQFAWSENPFSLFIALHLLFIWLDIKRPHLGYFALAMLWGALAFLTRYAGICVVFSAIVYALWTCWIRPAQRGQRAAILLASLALASSYIARNLIYFGWPFGSHAKKLPTLSPSEYFHELPFAIVRTLESTVSGAGATVALIIAALALIVVLTRLVGCGPRRDDGATEDSRNRLQFVIYLLLLIAAYWGISIFHLATRNETREGIDIYRSYRYIASLAFVLPVVLAVLLRTISALEAITKRGSHFVTAATFGILLLAAPMIAIHSGTLRQPSKTDQFWWYGSEQRESLDEIRSFILDAADEQRVVHIANGMLGTLESTLSRHYRSLFYRRRFLSGNSALIPEFRKVTRRDIVLDLSAGSTRYRIEYHDPNTDGFDSPQALADHVQGILLDNEVESIVLLTDDIVEDSGWVAAWSERQLEVTDSIRTGNLRWIRLQRQFKSGVSIEARRFPLLPQSSGPTRPTNSRVVTQ